MKAFRQGQILRVIQSKPVHTQEELGRELAALGVSATQVTLSRDMREMGLVKTKDGYTQLGEVPDRASLVEAAVLEFLVDVRTAQHMLVLRTPAAFANSLAIAIDRVSWPEVAGTVAGDDTVLVVCEDNSAAATVHQRLLQILHGAQ
jgi:transcriptional regulator of arginine metabolism